MPSSLETVAYYKCEQCGTKREYGVDKPKGDYKPIITCEGDCHKTTRHSFVRFGQKVWVSQ